VLAAQAGIAGHLKIGAGARIAAQSGVMRDVGPGEEVGGAPAMPIRQFWRMQARLSKLLNEQKNEKEFLKGKSLSIKENLEKMLKYKYIIRGKKFQCTV